MTQQSGIQNILTVREDIMKIKKDVELTISSSYKMLSDVMKVKFENLQRVMVEKLEEKMNSLKLFYECSMTEKVESLKDSYVEIINENVTDLKASYADIAKQNNNKINKKKDRVIVIKPKEKTQDFEKTKNDLKSHVTPNEVNINGLLKAFDGGIIVRCKNLQSTEKLKEMVENNMSKKLRCFYSESKTT
jgi:hypothetical protein